MTTTSVATILDGRADAATLGGKGGSLDRLIGWGIRVPPTGAANTLAYRRFVERDEVAALIARVQGGDVVHGDEIDEVFSAARFPGDDLAEISRVARVVGGGQPLAVRSSATVEDLEHSSFAGQYRSFLGIDAEDDLALGTAVKLVFASLWHPAPCAYRRSFGIDDSSASMAAVLMRMVPTRRAGVVFTMDPAGDPALARVEYVEGLGEALVSGRETPAALLLPRTGAPPTTPTDVAEALGLALEIESLAGRPQDVEWASDGGRVWIVQARPITVTGADAGDGFDDDPATLASLDLTTAGIGEMLPGVLPPLVWTLSSFLVEEAFRGVLDDLAALPDDVVGPRAVVRRVRGRAALDFGRLQAMARTLPGSAADQLELEYFGSRRAGREASPRSPAPRSLRSRLQSARHDIRVLRSGPQAASTGAMTVFATAGIVDAAPELMPLGDRDLSAYHLRLVDLAAQTMAAELAIAADATATYRRLQLMLSRHLGDVAAGRLADHVVARVGVTASVPESASAAVFAGPTWRELGRTPPRLGPGRDRPTADLQDSEEAAFDLVLDSLRAAPGWRDDGIRARMRVRAMRRLAHVTTSRLALREAVKASILGLGGEVRRIHLEFARRLVERGQLGEVADIDLLSLRELRGMLAGRPAVTPEVVASRRRWRRREEQSGSLPARFSGTPEPVPVTHLVGDRIEGWAASGGRYRGKVQVVRSPDEELTLDAVLVAEATDPSWSPLFMRAGAIVLDRGGPLSHAAILAREIGVPAVLNVPGATTSLAGRDVTVDGDAGVVIVHEVARGLS